MTSMAMFAQSQNLSNVMWIQPIWKLHWIWHQVRWFDMDISL